MRDNLVYRLWVINFKDIKGLLSIAPLGLKMMAKGKFSFEV